MSNEKHLADRSAIRDLSNCYACAIDRMELEQLHKVFTVDGRNIVPHLNIDMQGVNAIIGGIEPIKDMFKRTLHCMLNQTIEFSDDGATANTETYCVANHIYDDEQGVERKMDMGIRYQDELVKDKGHWRIQKRILNLDWQQDLPLQG